MLESKSIRQLAKYSAILNMHMPKFDAPNNVTVYVSGKEDVVSNFPNRDLKPVGNDKKVIKKKPL